jgi:hypothetical protein
VQITRRTIFKSFIAYLSLLFAWRTKASPLRLAATSHDDGGKEPTTPDEWEKWLWLKFTDALPDGIELEDNATDFEQHDRYRTQLEALLAAGTWPTHQDKVRLCVEAAAQVASKLAPELRTWWWQEDQVNDDVLTFAAAIVEITSRDRGALCSG